MTLLKVLNYLYKKNKFNIPLQSKLLCVQTCKISPLVALQEMSKGKKKGNENPIKEGV